LPDTRYARYGCSEKGLVLLTDSREKIETRRSGSLVSVQITGTEPHDKKSGAIVVSG
jgi:hypothetical protein